ncbi:MAG: hypothetical protein ABEJ42_02480 [Halobacteriaceae archaeon]
MALPGGIDPRAALVILGTLVVLCYALYREERAEARDQPRLPEQFREGSDPESSVEPETEVHNRVRDGDSGEYQ